MIYIMFKVNHKDTRTTSMTLLSLKIFDIFLWCFYCSFPKIKFFLVQLFFQELSPVGESGKDALKVHQRAILPM